MTGPGGWGEGWGRGRGFLCSSQFILPPCSVHSPPNPMNLPSLVGKKVNSGGVLPFPEIGEFLLPGGFFWCWFYPQVSCLGHCLFGFSFSNSFSPAASDSGLLLSQASTPTGAESFLTTLFNNLHHLSRLLDNCTCGTGCPCGKSLRQDTGTPCYMALQRLPVHQVSITKERQNLKIKFFLNLRLMDTVFTQSCAPQSCCLNKPGAKGKPQQNSVPFWGSLKCPSEPSLP